MANKPRPKKYTSSTPADVKEAVAHYYDALQLELDVRAPGREHRLGAPRRPALRTC